MEEKFESLGLDDLVVPGVKVEMSKAFLEVFKSYSYMFDPEEGEKLNVFDAHRLIESICCTWAELYAAVATSCEIFLRGKASLDQEVKKLTDREDGRVKKLTGELDICYHKLREIQDALAERGTTIFSLEQHIVALFINPLNVAVHHTSSKCKAT